MNISCPECNTVFTIPKELIGEFGRKVKCSKCSYIWHQTLENQIKIDSKQPIEIGVDNKVNKNNGINLPALLPKEISEPASISSIFLLILIKILLVILFYEKFGIKLFNNSHEWVINNIKIENNLQPDKIIVNYTLNNISNNTISVPLIRIKLLDKNNKVIDTHIIEEENLLISPKNNINLQTEFFSHHNIAVKIDISIGNKLDFILK